MGFYDGCFKVRDVATLFLAHGWELPDATVLRSPTSAAVRTLTVIRLNIPLLKFKFCFAYDALIGFRLDCTGLGF